MPSHRQQELQFQETLAACLEQPGVHVIELPIDYAASAQLQVTSPPPRDASHAFLCTLPQCRSAVLRAGWSCAVRVALSMGAHA